MVAVCLIPVYVALNLYALRWLLRWMGACHRRLQRKGTRIATVVIYSFFASAVGIAFLLPTGKAQRIMYIVGNYWMGVFLYTLLTVAAADAIRLVLRLVLRKAKGTKLEKERSHRHFVAGGAVCVAIIAAFSIVGITCAHTIQTTDYALQVDKSAGGMKSMKVVLVADLHMGYSIGCGQMERMVKAINRENADLVVIAGDIFDNEYEALEDPEELAAILRGIESKYGVYACYGNHDIQEKLLMGFSFQKKGEKKMSDIRMDRFLEKAGIQLLRDESVLIGGQVYLYGRPDMERPGRGVEHRKTPEEITANMDREKPIFVIDHEPAELQELADAGVDVDLCGHTHDGQVFPGNLTIRLFWENAYGYLKKGGMHNIVTSGAGVFGPAMRVGTKAEICAIDIRFE